MLSKIIILSIQKKTYEICRIHYFYTSGRNNENGQK
jgi:hypothetical protein